MQALTHFSLRGFSRAALLSCLSVAALMASQAAAQSPPAPAQTVEQAVIKVLRERPELVRDALAALEKKETASKAKIAKAMLSKQAGAIASELGATVLGNPKGKVTVVEFIDYRCGYCKQMGPVIDALIQADPDVRVLVKNLPILGPDSLEASRLVLATEPAKRAELHHKLLGQSLDTALLQKLQAELGVSAAEMAKTDATLGEVRKLSVDLGIQGTPALVVGSAIFYGAISPEQLASAVNTARSGKK